MQDSVAIAAISTAQVGAGMGTVRISGQNAAQIADRVFSSAGGRKLSEIAGYTALYGRVHDAEGDIDAAVALRFVAPHSYTGEDTVELTCHGGVYILRRVLAALIAAGARPAKGGEFTRRAFLNGKLDLTEAESVINLISAGSSAEHAAALSAHDGRLYRHIEEAAQRLRHLMADITAWVDFPDEDVPDVTAEHLAQGVRQADGILADLLDSYECGRILREGVDTAIVGRPNVGKSTVMNLLLGCQRSIVTDVAGTTRDVIEESAIVGGIKLNLCDTAGIREATDAVERIGVQLATERLGSAGIVLAVFDGSQPLCDDDLKLLDRLDGQKTVAVVNKCDLDRHIELERLRTATDRVVCISAKTGEGAERLSDAICQLVAARPIDPSQPVLQSQRQQSLVISARGHLAEAVSAAEMGITLDAVGACIESALMQLYELTGQRVSDSVIDDVFSRFCVGK